MKKLNIFVLFILITALAAEMGANGGTSTIAIRKDSLSKTTNDSVVKKDSPPKAIATKYNALFDEKKTPDQEKKQRQERTIVKTIIAVIVFILLLPVAFVIFIFCVVIAGSLTAMLAPVLIFIGIVIFFLSVFVSSC